MEEEKEERVYIPYTDLGVANGDEWDSLSDEEQKERLRKADQKRCRKSQ